MASRVWRVFGSWRVVEGFLQNFLHPRVHERIFEKNPPQPSTGAKPSTGQRRRRSCSSSKDGASQPHPMENAGPDPKAGPRVVMLRNSRTHRPEKQVNSQVNWLTRLTGHLSEKAVGPTRWQPREEGVLLIALRTPPSIRRRKPMMALGGWRALTAWWVFLKNSLVKGAAKKS